MNFARGHSSHKRDDHRPALLKVVNLTKHFGQVVANENISLHVEEGEIHALLGENGAGKSTLVKMIYGALQADSGKIFWRGEPALIANPTRARDLGIGMIFQHFSLFEALTVTENIALALPDEHNLPSLAGKIEKVSRQYGLPLQADALVADLSVGERQRIEIVRCLLQQPRLLIMDEPTAVLTPQEAGKLFKTLKRLALEGCAILYISHRLEEVRQLCDRATILRRGRVVASIDPRQNSARSLAGLMVGNDIHAVSSRQKNKEEQKLQPDEAILSLSNLHAPSKGPFAVGLADIDLQVYRGEILAIAGVAGNGQSELFEILSGERLCQAGDMISFKGENIGRTTITRRRRMGAAFVPEERLGHGAVPGLSLRDNVVLSRHATRDGIVTKGVLRPRKACRLQHHISRAYDVRKQDANPEARSLSGGNLQKFVVGRELDRSPDLLVINQPTWGVDAGAAALIRQELVDLAANGSAILLISQDLDEIFEIAHRVSVISRGRLSPPLPAGDLCAEEIGLMMAGSHETPPDHRPPAPQGTISPKNARLKNVPDNSPSVAS